MKRNLYSLLLCLVIIPASLGLNAQDKQKIPFRDSTDGAFDLSYFLSTFAGFMPLVMPITEPALGYGLAGGPVFIHRDMEALERGEPSPPSLSMIGGLYTENGTWGVMGLHSGVWKNDHIRYLGAAYYATAFLTYYPPMLPNLSADFRLRIWGTIQQIAYRPFEPKVFVGLRYQFSSTGVGIKTPGNFLPDYIEPEELVNNLATAGPVVFLDYRDNSFTPNKGIFAKATYLHADTWLGSEVKYNLTQAYATWFTRPTSWLVTGLRAEFQNSWGRIPFFAKPFVNLRGIPAMRYQDYYTLTFETEERFDLSPRWSLTAFGGLAKAFNVENSFSDYNWVYNYGAGFRYKIARLFGIYSGIDFGFGPDGNWAFYVIFGHAWNRS